MLKAWPWIHRLLTPKHLLYPLFQEEQYAKWMAAFRLASKGKTMADSSYDQEVQSILAFLAMQHPAPAPVLSADQLNFQPEDFVATRFLRKLKTKQVRDVTIIEPGGTEIGLRKYCFSDMNLIFSFWPAILAQVNVKMIISVESSTVLIVQKHCSHFW